MPARAGLRSVKDGMSRTDAAQISGMDRPALRNRMHRFNASALPACSLLSYAPNLNLIGRLWHVMTRKVLFNTASGKLALFSGALPPAPHQPASSSALVARPIIH
jgi:hypothetical protein